MASKRSMYQCLKFSNPKIVNEREMFWIAELQANVLGYNMTKGGDGVLGLKHTAESNRKNALSHVGRVQSEKTCRLRSFSLMRSSKVVRRAVSQHDASGKLLQSFSSLCDAERSLNKPGAATLIARCCNGKTLKAYGFSWRYTDGKVNVSKQRKRSERKHVEKVDLVTGEIVETFVSLAAAMRSVQRLTPAIRNCCHGLLETAYGYRWRFKQAND